MIKIIEVNCTRCFETGKIATFDWLADPPKLGDKPCPKCKGIGRVRRPVRFTPEQWEIYKKNSSGKKRIGNAPFVNEIVEVL